MRPRAAKHGMPSHLRFAGLQPRTIRAYRAALERFTAFTKHERLPLRTKSHLDFAIGEYLNTLYQEGDSLAQGGHFLSGLKRFRPELRFHLPSSSQYFRNWQRIHRPERAVPISWQLLQALAAICLELDRPAVALMLYVGFFCFLRTAEMLSLQCHHLVLHDRKPQLAIIVPFAKTSNGNPQVLTFQDALVHRLAHSVLQTLPKDAYLWAPSWGSFRKFWSDLLAILSFSSEDYTPYGIRRGGATWHFLETASMDMTLHKGRWTTSKVARQYIDSGTLAMAKMVWTARQQRRVKQFALKGANSLKRLRQKKQLGTMWAWIFVSLLLLTLENGSRSYSLGNVPDRGTD